MKTTEVTEMCPHCQNEVTVQWDVENDGYELYCPYCGFPIMLCSMCDARDGKVCDWEEIKGCKYSDERYRDYFYKNLSCENAAEIAISSQDNDIWIPVEERLPGIGRKVLVSFRYTGWQPVIAFLSEEHRWLMLQGMKGYNDVTHDVSAWMPLPKPYHPKSEDWKENLLKKFDKRT